MINITNESKWVKIKKEEALIRILLTINFLLKVIQSIIISVNIHKQKMIWIWNENKKIRIKDKWNYCHNIPTLPFLKSRYRLQLLHVHKYLSGLKKQKNVLMSLKLDIWLIQICMLINPSENKWKNLWIICLVHSHTTFY